VPVQAQIPAPRADISQDRRERAAQMMLAVAYGHCPEQIVHGIAPRIVEAFEIEMERAEALAHVDLLLDVVLSS
jgi:hypothetical protein